MAAQINYTTPPSGLTCSHPEADCKKVTLEKIENWCIHRGPEGCPCLIPTKALEGRSDEAVMPNLGKRGR